MTKPVDPASVITAEHGAYLQAGRAYPRPLPTDLAPWYLYLADSGHCIAVLLPGHENQGTCPAPVKAVLATGWHSTPTGHIVSDLPYDTDLGLCTDPAHTEFQH